MADVTSMDEDEPLPITMSQEVFEDADDPRCFVLVDGEAVQGLLTGQEDTLCEVDAGKGVRMVQVQGERDSNLLEDERGMLGMKDDKMGVTGTVEVVHVECGKTLEVMHIDGGKSVQVIHIEGGGKLDFIGSDRDDVKVVVPSSGPSISFRTTSKGHLGPQDTQTPIRRVVTTTQTRNHITPTLRSLGQSITQPIMVSTGKSSHSLTPSHTYCCLPPVTAFPPIDKSQNITAHEIGSNIIISGTKEVLEGTEDSLDNAIIISWPNIPEQEMENTVGTQTEPFEDLGSGLNLFFCTFHADGSVETYCDLPAHHNKGVSGGNRSRCTDREKVGRHYLKEDEEGIVLAKDDEEEECEEIRQTGTGKYQRFSRSGRILRGKGPLFRADAGLTEEDLKGDPDFEVQEEELEVGEAAPQIPSHRRKRGRKRKKRPPSPDNFEEDLQLATEKVDEEEEQGMKDESGVNEEDEGDSEVALEVLRKKGYGLRTKRRLKKLTDMHYLQEQMVRRQPDHSRLFPCRVCERSFPTFFRLQRHAKDEHNLTNFSFPCDVCGMAFTRPHNLERHKETKHSAGQKRFACEQCGRRFARQDVLSVHISMVHLRRGGQKGSLPHAGSHHCTGCDNFFSREQRLREHRRGDFSCGKCAITFECRTALRIHLYKSHPTTCTECGKVCNSKQQMYFHRQTHTPKFACKFCDKGFMCRSQYAVHMATHTGDRPVPCDVCGKFFAHKVAVSKHKWQEHNENNKKFKCEQCGKCFVYRGKLASHMRSHTGEKPFTCQACSSTFSQRSNLNAHIKSVHGVVVKSVNSDGTTHTEVVKYKRPKKTPPTPSVPPPNTDLGNNTISQVELPPPPPQPPHIDIQDQVHMSESSLETEAAVYQIVYAYPQ